MSNDQLKAPKNLGKIDEAGTGPWRAAPPTVDEVRVCPLWWHRTLDEGAMLGPSVISLDVEDDGVIFVAESGGERFLPEDWGNEWAPCLPPMEGKIVGGSFVSPPANPTTRGDVWTGVTKPAPEAPKRFMVPEQAFMEILDELRRLRGEVHELRALLRFVPHSPVSEQ
jgi:hypothetical protein